MKPPLALALGQAVGETKLDERLAVESRGVHLTTPSGSDQLRSRQRYPGVELLAHERADVIAGKWLLYTGHEGGVDHAVGTR